MGFGFCSSPYRDYGCGYSPYSYYSYPRHSYCGYPGSAYCYDPYGWPGYYRYPVSFYPTYSVLNTGGYYITQPAYESTAATYVDTGGSYAGTGVEDASRPALAPGLQVQDSGSAAAVALPPAGDYRNEMPAEQMHQLMIEGVNAFTRGEYEGAAGLFLRVAMADTQNVDATLAYAVARFATGDYPTSATAVRRAVRVLPEVVDSPFGLQERYGQLADLDKHLQTLTQYVYEHPDNVDGWIVLGFVQHFSGQRDLAGRTFDVVKRLSAPDADLANTFLSAKPVEQQAPSAPAYQPGPDNDDDAATAPATGVSVGPSPDEPPSSQIESHISLKPVYEPSSP